MANKKNLLVDIHHRKTPVIGTDSRPNVVYSDEITLKRRLNLWSGICMIIGNIIGKQHIFYLFLL